MGIRETINEKPVVGIGIFGSLVVIAIILVVWQVLRSRPHATPLVVTDQVFFSDDDGKTWFPESKDKLPPFMHNGKPAYLAKVVRCGDSGKPFVAYLEKYPDDVKRDLEARLKSGTSQNTIARAGIRDLLAKKPGTGEWVSRSDVSRYEEATHVDCPEGFQSVGPGEK
jgi:hypothetical protein